jgi:hypothetical protein
MYILELWAEDEAGNVGYFATIQVTFDSSKLQCQVVVLEVGVGWSVDEVAEVFQIDRVSSASVFETANIRDALVPENIRYKIVEVSEA